MEWERASPGAGAVRSSSSSSSSTSSEAVLAHDKKNKCNKPARANDLSNNNNPTTTSGQHQLVSRKNKPIPPPLDLSIGAANLSLHHQHHHHHHHPHNQNQSSTHHSSNLHPHSGNTTSHSRSPQQLQPQQQPWYHPHQQQQQQSPSGYLGSPKFNQSEKSLPLRKRWHSWSPVPGMNGQEDSGLMPSYTDLPPSPLAIKSEPQQPPSSVSSQQESVQESVTTSVANPNVGAESQNPLSAHSLASYGFSTATSSGLTTSSYRHHYGSLMNGCNSSSNNNHQHHHHHHHNNNNSNNNGLDLGSSIQTPSPFYTPNEPSPKVMNSNVFTYSTPDTSFYQGPFSPMRTPCVYYPPNSPFTHLSLNTPGGPNSGSSIGNGQGLGNGSQMMNLNMIPSTLLSPAPSQASTNSLSYEDLNLSEKSSSALLNFVPPMWSIFISGTKVRFPQSRHFSSTDWLSVDFLAQNETLLNLKGDYAPQGLEVRSLVVTSSSKERIQVTFCPVGDLIEHPIIEVDCEPGHPFMVEKKGWCSVKPDVFQELFGSHCLQLECGDVCLNMSRLGQQQQQQQNVPGQLNVVHPLVNVTSGQTPLPSISSGSYALNLNGNLSSSCSPNSSSNSVLNNLNNLSPNMNIQTSSSPSCNVKFEPGLASVEEKVVPISILPASQTTSIQSIASQLQHLSQQQQSAVAASLLCSSGHGKMFAVPSSMPSAASSALPAPSAPAPSPAKRAKENQHNGAAEQKGRRPMNAFLLFAKDKRPELIQQYPGKDNRSISVLLGEAWANLEPPEKERYSSNARARAEEQKRIHPDCWKRKRSQSTSS